MLLWAREHVTTVVIYYFKASIDRPIVFITAKTVLNLFNKVFD